MNNLNPPAGDPDETTRLCQTGPPQDIPANEDAPGSDPGPSRTAGTDKNNASAEGVGVNYNCRTE